MASQYVVVKNEAGGYDVLMRDLHPPEEYSARMRHMIEQCGFSEEDAAAEIAVMVAQFHKKNMVDDNSLSLSEQYVWDTMDPGDVIFFEDRPFIVQRPRPE